MKVAIVGVGNCAAAFVRGIAFYRQEKTTSGLISSNIGGYAAGDIEIVAAFDVDDAKVGRPLAEALRASKNCTLDYGVSDDVLPEIIVNPAPRIDGIGTSYATQIESHDYEDISIDFTLERLRESGAKIIVNYLPVGSEIATAYWAEIALQSGCAFVNAIPVFIANDSMWRQEFENHSLPLIGDDLKSQVGATIVHRDLLRLILARGYDIQRTYQLNVGGNMDFKNMLDSERLASKRKSKTQAVTSIATDLKPDDIHIGPSDYVKWLGDKKVAFIRVEATGFGGAPMSFEARLEVWDSPNSAGVVTDLVRYAQLALEAGVGGVLDPVCSAYMKSAPFQLEDSHAAEELIRYESELSALASAPHRVVVA